MFMQATHCTAQQTNALHTHKRRRIGVNNYLCVGSVRGSLLFHVLLLILLLMECLLLDCLSSGTVTSCTYNRSDLRQLVYSIMLKDLFMSSHVTRVNRKKKV